MIDNGLPSATNFTEVEAAPACRRIAPARYVGLPP